MKRIKQIFCILLCILFVMPAGKIVCGKNTEADWPQLAVNLDAASAVLMNADTETILYEKKADKKRYPASITKILTTLIAVEQGNMDDIVTFSEDAVYKTEGSGIWREVGEKLTLEQCLYAVMLESANECAYAVAEHVGGTYDHFIEMMNQRAKEIGCKHSHFVNPNGLPDENHYVTARDMAKIAREAYKNEMFRTICGTDRYVIPATNKHKEPTYMQNHHKMLFSCDGVTSYLYESCTGGKTGYTDAAGNTLVTYAERDGMTLISVVLKGHNPAYWTDTRNLLDFGFENFSTYKVAENIESGNQEENPDVLNTNSPYAKLDENAKIILPKTAEFGQAAKAVDYANATDTIMAQLKFTYGGHAVGSADIIQTGTKIDKADLEQTVETEKKEAETGVNERPDSFHDLFTDLMDSGKLWIILAVLVLVLFVFLLIIFLYQKSHNFRRNLANRKNEKLERKRYTIIPDNSRKNKKK